MGKPHMRIANVWKSKAWLVAAVFAGATALGQGYQESPTLAAQVAAGQLPPVEERLPSNPLVVNVVDEIGQYGGVLRRAFLGPADANNYVRWVYDALLRFEPGGGEVVPHLFESFDANDDFSVWTMRLREGARWSDGHPFTADDILFWYEAVMLNSDLTPGTPPWMSNSDGSMALVEKVDDYTVRYTFDQAYTLFPIEMTFRDGGDRTIAAYLPAHYMAQFHPDYTSDAAALQQQISAAGYQNWTDFFLSRSVLIENPDRPGMAAWVPFQSSVSDQEFVLRRNPYYIGVDAAGNQLPYIDEVRFRFFADAQTLNFAAVAGEFDMQERHIQMTNYPVLVQNAERSGYRVQTWPSFGGSDAAVWFNPSYDIDPELGALLANRDFRRALSMAINRDEIRESAFLGLGEPRQAVPAPWHPYYPGDEHAYAYTELDQAAANALLDGLGLTRSASGARTLPSGRPLNLELSIVPAFGPWPDVGQLIAADWGAVGVNTIVQVRERTAHFQMRDSNELQVEIWNEDTSGFPFTGGSKVDPRSTVATIFGTGYRTWYESGGERGNEPPDSVKRMVAIIDEAKTVGVEGQIALAHELYEIVASELFSIGTVGLTPMIQGVVVINQNLVNVPLVVGNDWPLRTPGNSRPEQFFYRQ